MATKTPNPPARPKPQPPTGLKAERIQLALQSLPGWAVGPPQQQIERTFYVPSEDRLGRFVSFLLQAVSEEEAEYSIHIQFSHLNIRLGGMSGVNEAHLAVAEAINASPWAQSDNTRAA